MTSAWSPRRGSDRCGRRWRWPLAVLLLAATAGTAAAIAAPAPATGRRCRLVVADADSALPRLAAWRRADVAWLASLPDSLPLSAAPGDSGWVPWLSTPADTTRRHRVRAVTELLRDRWQRRGFLDCRVTVARAGTGPATLRVVPGPRFRWGHISVTGGTPREVERWRAVLPLPGDPVEADAFRAAVDRLLAVVGDDGYPFARWLVRAATVTRAPPRATLTVEVLTGPRCVIGPQAVSLSRPRERRFVARASGLRPGEPFRQRRLAEARDRLLRRDLYAAVDTPVVFTTAAPGTVGVWWPIRPRRHANLLEVVLGWQRTAEGGGHLSGQVHLLLPNLAGTGRRLDLGWRDDGRQRSRFGFSWLEPLVGGTPLDLALAVDHEVERDVYTRFRTRLELSLPVHGGWDVTAGAGWDRGTFPAGDWRSTRRWRTWAGLVHHRLDRRSSGWSARLAVATATRSAVPRDSSVAKAATDTVTVGLVGGDQRQTLLSADLAGEWFASRTVSLAGRVLWRSLEGDTPGAPLTEQFRLGGANTLRGYAEDRFHGERVGLLSLELRLGRPGRSRVYAFLDVGYVRLYRPDAGQTVQRPRGFGLGLQTRAAAGNVALAVGFPGTVRFDDAKLHVTLQQQF